MIPKDKEDLKYLTYKELKHIPKKKIDYIINHFWETLRYFITHPLETKKGIKIDGFLKFYIPVKRTIRYRDKALARKTNVEQFKEFYNQLLKNISDE